LAILLQFRQVLHLFCHSFSGYEGVIRSNFGKNPAAAKIANQQF